MSDDLADWRQQINNIDEQLFKLLEARFAIVKQVGEYKKQYGMPVRNTDREAELVRSVVSRSKLEESFIDELYQQIFNYSYKLEE